MNERATTTSERERGFLPVGWFCLAQEAWDPVGQGNVPGKCGKYEANISKNAATKRALIKYTVEVILH